MRHSQTGNARRTASWIKAVLAAGITATVGTASAQAPPDAPDFPSAGPSSVQLTPNVNDQFSDDPGNPNAAITSGVAQVHSALYPNNLIDDQEEDAAEVQQAVLAGSNQPADVGNEEEHSAMAAPIQSVLKVGEVIGNIDEIRSALSDGPMVGLYGGNSATNLDGTVRVIVTLRPPAELAEASAAGQRAAIKRAPDVQSALAGTASVVETVGDSIGYMVVSVDSAGLDALLGSDAVGAVELDKLWGLELASSGPVTRVDDVYEEGIRGDGDGGTSPWEVVIIDTGVRKTHEKMSPNVVAEACYTTDASCPNGQNSMVGSGAGAPCSGGANNCDHGTFVASIAAGDTSGGAWSGTSLIKPGYSPEANIVAVNVFQGPSNSPSAFTSSVLNALNYVVGREAAGGRVASVNLSVGGGQYMGTCDAVSASVTTAVNTLRSAGMLPFSSSGNSGGTGHMSWPACISAMVSVGGTADDDTVSWFSDASSVLDLWAPGSLIYAGSAGSDTQYESKSGTSYASPAAAGAAAVLYDCPDWNEGSSGGAPLSTYDDIVLSDLKGFGVSVTDQRAGGTVTKPRVDVYASAEQYNDNNAFATPETISGSNIDYTTCGTIEAGEPYPLNYSHKSGSNWFTYTAPDDGIVEFTTCDASTNHNTSIAVWKGTSLSNLVLSAYDNGDSTCTVGIGTGADRVAVPVVDGEVLKVAVYGTNKSTQGRFRLHEEFTPDSTTPDPTTLLKPVSITQDLSPTYMWEDTGASHYRLWVNAPGGSYPDIMNWYSDAAVCSSGVCSVSAGNVAAGNVTWDVQTYTLSGGLGSWAGLESFTATTAVPIAPVKWTPTGNVTDSTPVYMWKASPSAEQYRIYSQVNNSYFTGSNFTSLTPADVNCPYGTGYCSFQHPAAHPTGPARYWIYADNSNGSANMGWQSYTRATGTGGAGLPYTPSVSSMAPNNPVQFTWSAHPGATNYRLFVRDAAGITRADVTLSAAAMGCSAGTGTCSRTVSGIPGGNARWFVRNKFGAVWGGWSRATWFTVPTQ